MSVYPKWMERRYARTIIIEIPIPGPTPPPTGGGGGGGGAIVRVEKPIPRVVIRKVVVLDDYDQINISVLRVIDLSLDGGM